MVISFDSGRGAIAVTRRPRAAPHRPRRPRARPVTKTTHTQPRLLLSAIDINVVLIARRYCCTNN